VDNSSTPVAINTFSSYSTGLFTHVCPVSFSPPPGNSWPQTLVIGTGEKEAHSTPTLFLYVVELWKNKTEKAML
jgi:hypothetical protein